MTLLRSFSIPHPAIDTEGIMRASRWRNVQATHDESAIKSATAPATLPATAPATTARQPKRRLAPPPQITPNAPPITTTANNEIAAKTAMMLACSATVTKRGHSSGHCSGHCSGHKIGNNPGNNFGNVSDNLTIHHAPPTPLHGPIPSKGQGMRSTTIPATCARPLFQGRRIIEGLPHHGGVIHQAHRVLLIVLSSAKPIGNACTNPCVSHAYLTQTLAQANDVRYNMAKYGLCALPKESLCRS